MQVNIKKLLQTATTSIEAELQQRACEYLSMLENPQASNLKEDLLKRMPPLDARIFEKEAEGETEEEAPEESSSPSQQQQNAPTTAVPAAAPKAGNLLDLDDLLSGIPSNPLVGNSSASSTPLPTGANLLSNLLDLPSSPSSTPQTPVQGGSPLDSIFGAPAVSLLPQAQSPSSQLCPPVVAFDQSGLQITFHFPSKEGNVLNVNMVSTNASSTQIDNFAILMAVPSYIKLQMAPPSGNTLPPGNGGTVEQKVKLMNTLAGQKPFLVKIKIDGQRGSEPITIVHNVANFPPNL